MAQNVALLTRDTHQNVALLERSASAVAPTITTASLPNGRVGVAYNQVVQATGTAPITTAVSVGTLPDGVGMTGATRTITGTPTTPQLAEFTVEATNAGGSATKALSILIPNEGVGGELPVVTTVTLVPTSVSVMLGQTTDLIVAVEDQLGEPMANLTGVIAIDTEIATAEQLAVTDEFGLATIRVTSVALGDTFVSITFDGINSNAASVNVFPEVIIELSQGVIEIEGLKTSVGSGTVIDAALGVIEIEGFSATLGISTTIDVELGVIEIAGEPATISGDVTADPSPVRMLVLKPDWIEGSGFYMVRGVATFVKSDDETLDYSINWSGILSAGETVIDSRWNLPDELTAGTAMIRSNITTQWLGGGIAGQAFDVDNIATTSKGRTYERSFRIQIVER